MKFIEKMVENEEKAVGGFDEYFRNREKIKRNDYKENL